MARRAAGGSGRAPQHRVHAAGPGLPHTGGTVTSALIAADSGAALRSACPERSHPPARSLSPLRALRPQFLLFPPPPPPPGIPFCNRMTTDLQRKKNTYTYRYTYTNKHQKCPPRLPPASPSHCASFPHPSLRHKAPPRAGPCPSPRGSPLPPLPPQPPPCSGKRAPHLRGAAAAALRNGPGEGEGGARGRWRRAAPAPCPCRAAGAPTAASHPHDRVPGTAGPRRGGEGSAGGWMGPPPVPCASWSRPNRSTRSTGKWPSGSASSSPP